MNEDKIDRTIEIILQQQAQFYADMEKMRELQERPEKRIDNLHQAAITIFDALKSTSNNIDNLSTKVNKLTNTVDKLANVQVNTDERLNAVIYMAEKYFSNKQNGN